MSTPWFIRFGDKDVGPLSTAQLKQLAQQGRMTRESLVRQGTTGTWVPATWIPDLFPAVAALPVKPGRPAAVVPQMPPRVLAEPVSPPAPTQLIVRAPARVVSAPILLPARRQRTKQGPALVLWGITGAIGVALVGLMLALMTGGDRGETNAIADNRPQNEPEPTNSPPEAAPDSAPEKKNPDESPANESKSKEPPEQKEPDPPREPNDPSKILTPEEIVKVAEVSIAKIVGRLGTGTGFLIRDRVLITNHHVVGNEFVKNVQVDFVSAPPAQKGPYTATLLYEDPRRDLSIFSVETSLPALKFASRQPIPRGQKVVVIGNTGVPQDTLPNAISDGTMSTEVKVGGKTYWQLTVPGAGPGNSGGPVINPRGEVIGVFSNVYTDPREPGRARHGLELCVPLPDSLDAMASLDAMTPEDHVRTSAKHDAAAVYHFAHRAGVACMGIIELYEKLGDHLATQGKTVNVSYLQLQQFFAAESHALVRQRQGEFQQISTAFEQSFQSEVPGISANHRLESVTRSDLIDLWTNFCELMRFAEQSGELGGRNWSRQKGKFTEVEERHRRMIDRVRLDLGIE